MIRKVVLSSQNGTMEANADGADVLDHLLVLRGHIIVIGGNELGVVIQSGERVAKRGYELVLLVPSSSGPEMGTFAKVKGNLSVELVLTPSTVVWLYWPKARARSYV